MAVGRTLAPLEVSLSLIPQRASRERWAATHRAAGWHALRLADLPLILHEHRGWSSMAPEERDRLSKRNFYRFLKHWGDRRDLLLHPGPRRTPAGAI